MKRITLAEANQELRELKTTVLKVHKQIERYNKELLSLEHLLSEYEDRIASIELFMLDTLAQSRMKDKH